MQRALALLALVLLFVINELTTSGKWATATNWSRGVKPQSSDEVKIAAGKEAKIEAEAKCRALIAEGTVTGTQSLTIGDATAPTEAAFTGIALKITLGATWGHTGVVLLEGKSATVCTITTNGHTLGALILSAAGKWQLEDALTTTGTVSCAATGFSLDTTGKAVTASGLLAEAASGSLTLGVSTVTLSGAPAGGVVVVAAGVTLSAAESTILLTNASETSKLFAGGGKAYGTVQFGGPNWEVTGADTFGLINVFNKGAAATKGVKLPAGVLQTVAAINFNGKAGELSRLESGTPGTKAKIKLPAGTWTPANSFGAVKDIEVTGGTLVLPNGKDEGGNAGIVFAVINVDAMNGTAVASGSSVEKLTGADSRTGTATATGSRADALVMRSEREGTVTATGVSADAAVTIDSMVGIAVATGVGGDAAAHSSAVAGIVTASGAGVDHLTGTDAQAGLAVGVGTRSDAYVARDVRTGTATAEGSSFESWTSSNRFSDHMVGFALATGQRVDSYVARDLAHGSSSSAGSAVERLTYGDALTGVVTASGSGADALVGVDQADGVATASGTLEAQVIYRDRLEGIVTASGSGVESWSRKGGATIRLVSLPAARIKMDSLPAARILITTPEV